MHQLELSLLAKPGSGINLTKNIVEKLQLWKQLYKK